jgi:O-6-methylguanine DNA methyltransferase
MISPIPSFSERVKTYVRLIPKGEVRTYIEVATAAGNDKAARAAANVMKANYDPTVPCHRVIRSDGTLGGYNRGGTEAKRDILRSEGYTI